MSPVFEHILRLIIAGVIGGAIGFEREMRAKEAGFRTHFLVALGSALFMLVSQFAFEGADRFDSSRVAAQVVSGIGFIGAGTIIFQKNSVKGLTTAAGLWVTAAIGLACGSGMWVEALIASVFTIACLEVMHFAHRKIGQKNVTISFSTHDRGSIEQCLELLGKIGRTMDTYSMVKEEGENGKRYHVTVDMRSKSPDFILKAHDILGNIKGVSIDRIE
ncbi:MAG: MgtC/SapB family protein [Bacteroidales bacterium]|nr:MgtC/SapB family protein [Bacteroidales bacterium]